MIRIQKFHTALLAAALLGLPTVAFANGGKNDCHDGKNNHKHDWKCDDGKGKDKHDGKCDDDKGKDDCKKNHKHDNGCKKDDDKGDCKKNHKHDNGCKKDKDDCKGNLECDAGGSYVVQAGAGLTTVQLDGTGSSGATSFSWTTSCPDAFFDNPHSPTPILTIPGGSACGLSCSVTLEVAAGNKFKSCSASVKVKDTTPPVLECPETSKIVCGDSILPDDIGYPTVSDNCDANPKLTYTDKIEMQACPAERFDHVIKRTWKATDKSCNVTTCVQTIDVLKVLTSLDVLPGQCPNDFKVGSSGFLPVTILGGPNFDVSDVNWGSIKLYGEHCEGGPVKPKSFCLGDVASPFFGGGGAACECDDANGDGILDLTVYFKKSEITQSLGLCSFEDGDKVRLVVIGKLSCEGCKFIATDCITIR